MNLQAIAFDAYGTLCSITERTNPLAELLAQINMPATEAKRICMTRNLSLEFLSHCLAPGQVVDVAAIERKVQREVDSVQLFADVEETLERLKAAGLQLVVVSNLALPYAEPVRRLLGDRIDHYVWSFEVGAVKPEAAIFAEVCRRLNCSPAQVLMVGDSLTSDVAGAQQHGMAAIHLSRSGKGSANNSISNLADLLELIATV